MRTAQIAMWLVVTGIVGGGVSADEPKKVTFKLTRDEQKLLELTNAERKTMDLPPLKANPILCLVARSHAQNMAKQEMLKHDLDDKTPFDRMKDAKYDYQRAGENIAMSGDPTSMADIFKLWMDSEGHRANILSEHYQEIGLGVARNANGDVYCTQVFGTPFPKE